MNAKTVRDYIRDNCDPEDRADLEERFDFDQQDRDEAALKAFREEPPELSEYPHCEECGAVNKLSCRCK